MFYFYQTKMNAAPLDTTRIIDVVRPPQNVRETARNLKDVAGR